MEIKRVFVDGKYPNHVEALKCQIIEGDPSFQITDDFKDCDIYLAFDLIDKNYLRSLTKNKTIKVLIRQEPKIVLPETYNARILFEFDLTIDIGKSDSSHGKVINWPQDLSKNTHKRYVKKEKVVMVNSNLLSLADGEMYSLRRQAISNLHNLDIYGYQWNNSFFNKLKTCCRELNKYKFRFRNIRLAGLKLYFKEIDNYLGQVEDKRATISSYKYCLVIENSIDYVSEKVFDSLLSECIPIYVGPELSRFEIPPNLYFQAKPNLVDIENKIEAAKKIDFNEWRNSLNSWVSAPSTYQNWSQQLFIEKIFKVIQEIYQ